MKQLWSLVPALLLAACVSNPPSGPAHLGYPPGQNAPAQISEYEAETLTSQYLEFKLKRQEMSAALGATHDPATRSRYIQNINELTRAMEPLAYRLRAAGRPLP